MPVHHHDAVMSDDAAKAAWLRDIRDLGFVLMQRRADGAGHPDPRCREFRLCP